MTTKNWVLVVLLSFSWIAHKTSGINQPTSGTPVYFHFTYVVKLPKADLEINLPFSFQGQAQCARYCMRHGVSCQGFIMRLEETYPCTLLIGLNGKKDSSNTNVKAYVNLYFEGSHYAYQTKLKQLSFDKNDQICKSMGRRIVSYPTSEGEENFLHALTQIKFYVNAMKDEDNPSIVKDLATGQEITVHWRDSNPGTDDRRVIWCQGDGSGCVAGRRVNANKFIQVICK